MLQSKIQCMVKMKQWPDFFVPNRFQKVQDAVRKISDTF